MGQAIHYCYRCSTQLREAHFEQGKAYRIDSRVCCADCAPEAIRSLPADRVQMLLSQISAKEKRPPTPSPRASSPRIETVPEKPSSRNLMLIGGGVAVLLVILIVVLLSGKSEPPSPPPTRTLEKPVSKLPSNPQQPAKPDGPAARALKKAQDFARANPEDLFGQLREYEDLTLLEDKSEAGAEARKAAQALRQRGKEAVERAAAALDPDIAGLLGQERFGAAIDALEAARARMGWPEWKLALDRKTREVQERADKLYEPLKPRALEAKAKGNAADLTTVTARVQGWGVARLVRDLDEALAGVSAPPVKVALDGFETPATGMQYVPGWEFPGAKGGLTPDPQAPRSGAKSGKLEADFSGGGAYIGLWYDLSHLRDTDFKEIRLWVKTSTVTRLGVRFADSTGQVHQKNGGIPIPRADGWQEIVIRIGDVVGGERWAGANDGKWHGPFKGFGLNVGRDTFLPAGAKGGVLWLDDVEGILVPDR